MRHKEFNKNKVLENCISLFWSKSFNGSPVNDIVKVTGVNRFSLYKEFENKHGILYESMKLYRDRYSDKYLNLLNAEGDLIQTLKNFYSTFLNSETHLSGCFIIYIATELGDNDEYVNLFLKIYLAEMETKFIGLLEQKDFSSDDAKVIANNLVLFFCNSMCYCHIQKENERMDFLDLNLNIIFNN